jgi:hypothetical protein
MVGVELSERMGVDCSEQVGVIIGIRRFACKEINQARIDALRLVFGVPDKRHHADEQQFA